MSKANLTFRCSSSVLLIFLHLFVIGEVHKRKQMRNEKQFSCRDKCSNAFGINIKKETLSGY